MLLIGPKKQPSLRQYFSLFYCHLLSLNQATIYTRYTVFIWKFIMSIDWLLCKYFAGQLFSKHWIHHCFCCVWNSHFSYDSGQWSLCFRIGIRHEYLAVFSYIVKIKCSFSWTSGRHCLQIKFHRKLRIWLTNKCSGPCCNTSHFSSPWRRSGVKYARVRREYSKWRRGDCADNDNPWSRFPRVAKHERWPASFARCRPLLPYVLRFSCYRSSLRFGSRFDILLIIYFFFMHFLNNN